jgi:RNA polymerase subunit RPABC4/transcription elongation factor Spt4
MALVKCKECGEQVSNKAKTCPKCGAKAPKKTSIFTWLVLFIIIFAIYAANQVPSSTGSAAISKPNVSTQKTNNERKTPPSKPSWSTSTSKDEMTGKISAYASSPVKLPTKGMSFPYSDVHAWLGVGCNNENEWAYIGFNSQPNLANTETEDGYNVIKTRIKWNSELENVVLTQAWGAKFIHFRNGSAAIEKIVGSNSALLELQWHGEQSTYFDFSLNGSSRALSEIRSKCSK